MKKSFAPNSLAEIERDLQQFKLIVFEGLFLGAYAVKLEPATDQEEVARRLEELGTALETCLKAISQPLQSFLAADLPPVTEELSKSFSELCAMLSQIRKQFVHIAKQTREGADMIVACHKLDLELKGPVHDKTTRFLETLRSFVESSYAIKAKTDNTHINTAIEQIGKIGTMINLIAVNASIEAARAGDSGRGFGVIASEIQVLSQRSKQAVEQLSARLD